MDSTLSIGRGICLYIGLPGDVGNSEMLLGFSMHCAWYLLVSRCESFAFYFGVKIETLASRELDRYDTHLNPPHSPP